MAPDTAWRVLIVEDNEDLATSLKDLVEAEFANLSVFLATSFESAQDALRTQRFDVLVLDVFRGEPTSGGDQAGRQILEELRTIRFVPVIFYTALPAEVEDLSSPPLVHVAGKGDAAATELMNALRKALESGLLILNRGILEHVEKIVREYLWEFVSNHWPTALQAADKRELAYLLARRLAVSLSEVGVEELAAKLGAEGTTAKMLDALHPVEMYVLPPVSKEMRTGEIVRGKLGEDTGCWIVLTPSCDLVERPPKPAKAERVLLAHADPLEQTDEFKEWQATPNSNTKRNALAALMTNNRRNDQADRFHFLPGAFTLPNLIVDFQSVITVPANELAELERVAVLDSPYAEALIARYVRYVGRVGTRDLDVNLVLQALQTPAIAPQDP